MDEHIVTDFWNYGCTVLRNASLNLKRHCDVVNKHNISWEKFTDSGFFPFPTSQNNSDIELTYILNIFGEKFEFHNEFLFKALSKLSSIRFRIVILYYCFEKTDKEICTYFNFPLVSLFNISDNKPLFNYVNGLKKWRSIMLLLKLIRHNHHSSRELLNEDLLKKVKMNDTDAILTLLDIFESEIKKNSYRKLYDEWGNPAAVVYDDDIASQLRIILIDAFKKIKLP